MREASLAESDDPRRENEAPPTACYRFSADREAAHPRSRPAGFAGWMRSDGHAGFGALARAAVAARAQTFCAFEIFLCNMCR